jgi:hypothetical protein
MAIVLHLAACARGAGEEWFVPRGEGVDAESAEMTVELAPGAGTMVGDSAPDGQVGSVSGPRPTPGDNATSSSMPDGANVAAIGSDGSGDATTSTQTAASVLVVPSNDPNGGAQDEMTDGGLAGDTLTSATGLDAGFFPSVDASGSGTAPVSALPLVGDLVITEVMFDPSGSRPGSEWFEIYNTAATARQLSGVTLVDGSGRTQRISDSPLVVLAPQQFSLLVRSAQVAIESGLSASSILYDYGTGLSDDEGIQLDDDDAGAISLWFGPTELAAASYGAWENAAWLGHSIELATVQLVGSDDPDNWCVAESAWGPDSDDGTPGLPNDCY